MLSSADYPDQTKLQDRHLAGIATGLALILGFGPQLFKTATAKPGPTHKYSAILIAPRAGEVLVPGQVYRIQWRSDLPNMELGLQERDPGSDPSIVIDLRLAGSHASV